MKIYALFTGFLWRGCGRRLAKSMSDYYVQNTVRAPQSVSKQSPERPNVSFSVLQASRRSRKLLKAEMSYYAKRATFHNPAVGSHIPRVDEIRPRCTLARNSGGGYCSSLRQVGANCEDLRSNCVLCCPHTGGPDGSVAADSYPRTLFTLISA